MINKTNAVIKLIKKELFASATNENNIYILSPKGNEYTALLLGKGIYMFRKLSMLEYKKMSEAGLGEWRIETNGQDVAVVYESNSYASEVEIANKIIQEIRELEYNVD